MPKQGRGHLWRIVGIVFVVSLFLAYSEFLPFFKSTNSLILAGGFLGWNVGNIADHLNERWRRTRAERQEPEA
jgi:hypothetical protein